MVAEISVHDDDEVATDKLQTVDVGGAEAELASAGLEDDMGGAEGGLEFASPSKGAVWGSVVDDYYFPVELSREWSERGFSSRENIVWRRLDFLLFGEDIVEHLHNDGQVLALIVGGEDDGVFVLGVRTHRDGRLRTKNSTTGGTLASFSGCRKGCPCRAGLHPEFVA